MNNFIAIMLYPLFTAAMFYLGSRAVITKWLWSRYPYWIDYYLSCAACCGALYGAIVSYIGEKYLHLTFLEMTGVKAHIIVAIGAMVWTPIVAYHHNAALGYLGLPKKPSNE